MDIFWKASAGILLAVILRLSLGKQEIGILMVMAVCCMTAVAAVYYLEPVLDFLWELQQIGELQGELLGTLIKAVGIGLVSEMIGMFCSDSGSGSLGKILQFLTSSAILYLSVPIFRAFVELIGEILAQL